MERQTGAKRQLAANSALGPDDYVRFAAPYSRALIERIRSTGAPVIHFGTGAAGFFRELHAAGGDVMGVDWRINIDQAWMDISYRSAVQGNKIGRAARRGRGEISVGAVSF